MKFNCSQVELKEKLSYVINAVPNRPSHPILGNFLLTAKADRLEMCGFDLNFGVKSQILATVEKEGTITIPAKPLFDIVSKLPNDIVYFSLEDSVEDCPLMEVVCGRAKFQLRGVHSYEYPELFNVGTINKFVIASDVLQKSLKSVLVSVANEGSGRGVLTGVRIEQSQSELVLVSTDGHRLTVVKFPLDENQLEFAITIPDRTLKEVLKMVKQYPDIILYQEDDLLSFSLGDNTVLSRVFRDTYPKHGQLIPSTFTKSITINRIDLIQSVERVLVLADKLDRAVKFTATTDGLDIAYDARGLGNATQNLFVITTGIEDKFYFCLDGKYLLEGIKAMDSEQIVLNINEADRPMVIRPINSLDITYLIMPIRPR